MWDGQFWINAHFPIASDSKSNLNYQNVATGDLLKLIRLTSSREAHVFLTRPEFILMARCRIWSEHSVFQNSCTNKMLHRYSQIWAPPEKQDWRLQDQDIRNIKKWFTTAPVEGFLLISKMTRVGSDQCLMRYTNTGNHCKKVAPTSYIP